jgi:hypothetical protein
MEPEGLLPHSQEPAIRLCADPDQSSPPHQSTSWRFILILFPHLRLILPNGIFISSLPTQTRYTLSSSHGFYMPTHLFLLIWSPG